MPNRLRAIIWAAVSTSPQADDDKASLPRQIQDAQKHCDRMGWEVIDILEVPGHSRYYKDLYECAADMRKEGITALDRLIGHWKAKDFDILICRDADRFARRPSLHARICEEILDAGASIYSFADGMIDSNNMDMFIAMAGYKTSNQIKTLVRYRKIGMPKRVAKGLASAKVLLTHRYVYDERGEPVGLVIDERMRPILDDIATVFLEGIPYDMLEMELFNRYGHVNPKNGKRFSYATIRAWFYNPYFWGHSAYNHASRATFRRSGFMPKWAYDLSVDPPSDVLVFRNTHESAYTGEMALRVQAEMRRREGLRGRASPRGPYPWTQLLVCAECNRVMSATTSQAHRGIRYRYWACRSRRASKRNHAIAPCSQTKSIRHETIYAYVHALLSRLYEKADLSILNQTPDNALDRAEGMRTEIDKLEREIDELVIDSRSAPSSSAREAYGRRINALGERIDKLRAALQNELLSHTEADRIRANQITSLDELRKVGPDKVLSMEPREINQFLLLLFGNVRLSVLNAQVVGLINRP